MQEKAYVKTRRDLLSLAFGLGLGAATGLLAKPRPARATPLDRRRLSFRSLHTGETLDRVYWTEGRYIPEALADIDYTLRDFRNGEVHRIDPALLDLLVRLRARLGTDAPFEVISGYRSPQTNAMLAAASEGVARHSLHLEGMAIDIRVPGRSLATLHQAALDLAGGGVGYYPASDFVHVDVGRVRHWG
jgi:uncharacterized protein YcbK (DUF882 family)